MRRARGCKRAIEGLAQRLQDAQVRLAEVRRACGIAGQGSQELAAAQDRPILSLGAVTACFERGSLAGKFMAARTAASERR